MSAHETIRSDRMLSLLLSLLVAAALAFAPAIGQSEEKKDDKKSEESADEQKSSDESKGDESGQKKQDEEKKGEKAAPPAVSVGGDASVPRPKEPVKLPTKKDPRTGQEVLVLTNDGLEKYFGPPPENLPSAEQPYDIPAAQAPDATQAQEPASEDGEMTADEARARAAEVQRELRRLRQNLLRFRNPLLPRPDVTEEESAEMQGRDNVERIAMTEQRIAELERELAELQARVGVANAAGQR